MQLEASIRTIMRFNFKHEKESYEDIISLCVIASGSLI
jgi:hypothetical protein